MVFLFPMLNLVWYSVAYSAGWYLNSIEAREVAVMPPIEPGGPTGKFVSPNYTLGQSQKWKSFMHVSEEPGSPVVAQFANTSNPLLVGQSTVETKVSIKPFLPIPFIAHLPGLSTIPGLGVPVNCTYSTTVVQEEQGQ